MNRYTVTIRPRLLRKVEKLSRNTDPAQQYTMIAPDWGTAYDAACEEWSGWEVEVTEWEGPRRGTPLKDKNR